MLFNYPKICQELLKDLPKKQKEVILRRFALSTRSRVKGETLESIGKDYGITRERVRQIEEDGISRIKPKLKKYQKVFQYFAKYLKSNGNLKKEDILLNQLGISKFQNQIFFLLTISDQFKRFSENKELHSFWAINPDSSTLAQKFINSVCNKLNKVSQPLPFKEAVSLVSFQPSQKKAAASFLEISKVIQKNPEGLFGLKNWPEINPRGVKDRAFLVFKKEEKPLHFTEVTNLIGSALPQTVHNELIKDPRFVLVGRGIYALKEWGYEEGDVKDVILKTLKESQKPMRKEEVLEKVLKQRLIKKNTILLNLSNRKYFLRDSQGKYTIRKA